MLVLVSPEQVTDLPLGYQIDRGSRTLKNPSLSSWWGQTFKENL
jgi:hypothetical protein